MVMPCLARFLITPSTSLTMVGSRAEVGSSKRMISGSMERQRAMATRCFCPPESCEGMALALLARPTILRSSMARSSASSRVLFKSFMGPMHTFSSMVRWLKRLNDWNTMPIFWRSLATLALGAMMSSPSTMISPLSGCSKRFKQRRKVLLPVPEGPIMEITSPLLMVTFMLLSTVRSPYFFTRFLTSIIDSVFLYTTLFFPLVGEFAFEFLGS